MDNYLKSILTCLQELYGVHDIVLTTPPNIEMGDVAIPCFALAKLMKKKPQDIAEEISHKVLEIDFIDKVEFVKGYVNVFIKQNILAKEVLARVISQGDKYGSSQSGIGKKILIEHTSINPNASPHIGRARNAIIGDSIVRLLRFEGYNVEVHYFVNDIGKQISMLLIGAENKNEVLFKDLLGIYVDINNRISDDKELESKVFELLYKLENGDKDTIEKFRKIVDVCISGQTTILNRLGIKHEYFDYESDYVLENKLNEILEKLKETGKLFEDEDGRYVLDFQEEGLPFLVLTRGDKTSLYPLRDIAYTIDKAKINAERNLIVLGEDQKTYFMQIKRVVSLLGYTPPEVIHYSFVLLAEGKMSTRKGSVVLLEDFMDEVIDKAKKLTGNRNDGLGEQIAEAVGYGAVKYSILRVSNDKNVTFDWDTALNFEGESAPYIQYNYARICSIFSKYEGNVPDNANTDLLVEKLEREIIKDLANFPIIIRRTINELSPHIITNYLFDLTKKFSRYYHDYSILNCDNKDLVNPRLLLAEAVRIVLKNAMSIIGITAIEKM